MKKQKVKNSGSKTIGNRTFGNRTIIGIVCIVAALAICFGIAPLINRVNDGKTEIVRICRTIGSFAQGLSGKLETGDIISVIVYSQKDGLAFTPGELQYIRVITSTTAQGVDKADRTDNTQPVTVTLLVNQEQAELLAQYEKSASMHFALEYRGDAATAQKYLDRQNEYFASKGA